MPGDRTSRTLDASLVIPTRVLRFEVSGMRHRTPVRPTGQTHRSDRPDAAASGLQSWLCGSTKEPSGFLVTLREKLALVTGVDRLW
jgi:hypothetical protein